MCVRNLGSLGTEGTNIFKTEIILESKQKELKVSSFSASANQFGQNPEQNEEGPVRSHSSIVRLINTFSRVRNIQAEINIG